MTWRQRHAGLRAQAVARALTWGALVFFGGAVHAAWHDDHPGSGVAVHYVHLTGHSTAVDVDRRNLIITQQACVDWKRTLGKSATLVSPDAVPKIVRAVDVEVYYGAERSLSVDTFRSVVVEPETCTLELDVRQHRHINTPFGECDVDVKRAEARGACYGGRIYPGTGPGPNLVISKEGETRSVAGVLCRLQRGRTDWELWIADLADMSERRPVPAAIRRIGLNGGFAGLLCAGNTPAMTLTADDVRMNLSVAPSLFALPPPDVKVFPGRSYP